MSVGLKLPDIRNEQRKPTPAALPYNAPELTTAYQASSDRRRRIVLLALAIGLTALFSVLVVLFHVLSAIALLTWIVCAAIAWRPFVGLCVAFALTQVFEAGGADQMMLPGFYLNGSLGSTVGLTGAIASPLELLLILVFCVWLAQGLARRKFDYRGGALGWPIVAFVGA